MSRLIGVHSYNVLIHPCQRKSFDVKTNILLYNIVIYYNLYNHLLCFCLVIVCSNNADAVGVCILYSVHSSHGRQAVSTIDLQNDVLTDQLCRAISCIHLSIMPMQSPSHSLIIGQLYFNGAIWLSYYNRQAIRKS